MPRRKKRADHWANVDGAMDEMHNLLGQLEDLAKGLEKDSGELLERSRRFVGDLRRRIGRVAGVTALIERRVREANAELRREVKLASDLRVDIRDTVEALPEVPRSGGNDDQA